MEDRKIKIGTVTVTRDEEMWNNQFQYAASFEHLLVKAGTYPIYTYESHLEKRNGKVRLDGAGFIGFEGTVIASNVGGKPGHPTSYHIHTYNYLLAHSFLEGHDFHYRHEYELAPEWGIEIHDFVSSFDNKRVFCLDIILKDGMEYKVM